MDRPTTARSPAARPDDCLTRPPTATRSTVDGRPAGAALGRHVRRDLNLPGPDQALEPPRRRKLPRRSAERVLSVHREPVPQRHHRRLRRRRILPGQHRHARPDGGLPAEGRGTVRLRARPPATGTVFADVPRLDPFARWIEKLAGSGDHGGLRRRPLLSGQPSDARSRWPCSFSRRSSGSGHVPPDGIGLFDDVEPVSGG